VEQKLEKKSVSREEMLKRVARFETLVPHEKGLTDQSMPGGARKMYNVVGFKAPSDADGKVISPVGSDASARAAIDIYEGFNLGFCRAKPGNGSMMHNHDTNETFVALSGTWRCSWENADGTVDHVDIAPYDTVSFPAGIARSFLNVTEGDPEAESMLLFVIGGEAPRAEFTDESLAALEKAGLLPPA